MPIQHPFRLVGQLATASTLAFILAACGGGNGGTSANASSSTTSSSTSSGGASSPSVTSAQVSTVAGSGAAGSTNGAGTAAAFNDPASIAIGANATLYVADTGNSLIRKIDASGNVTTLAGSSSQGSTNGQGTAASFALPNGIAVDASGNVTTLAGSGIKGSANGLGTAASFDTPRGIAVDASGIVYVADSGNNLIRRIDTSGNVTTLAGAGASGSANGQGTAASFNAPFGVAVDAGGNVYVADTTNNLIRKIDASGDVTTLAGSGAQGAANGQAAAASFFSPSCVAVDASGNVYVADTPNNLIRKITAAH